MAKRLVVEINDENIKIMEGSRKGNSLSIYKMVVIAVPSCSIEDGKLVKMDLVEEIIEKALHANFIKTKRAVFIINSNSVLTRKIELPYLKSNKETKSMINFKLQEIMSANVNQYKIIYKVNEIFTGDGIKKARFTVYGLPINVYNQYIELSKKLKLDLTFLDISSNLLEKISENNLVVNDEKIPKNSSIAFINAGNDTISFSVINKGIAEFFRKSHMTQKEIKTMDRVAETVAEYYNASSSISDVLVNEWLDEIRKYMRYYYSINKENIIKKIYVYGDNPEIEFGNEIFSDLDVDVEIINEVTNITANDTAIEKSVLNKYFNLLLAFYCSKNDINFLTDKNQYHKFKFNLGVSLMAAALILTIISAYNALNYFIDFNLFKNETAAMRMFINNSENIALNSEIDNIKDEYAHLEEYYLRIVLLKEIIENEDIISSEIFEEIKKAAPSGTMINSIFVDKNNIELQCSSITLDSVGMFISNLRAARFVNNVYMPSVVTNQENGILIYSYEVICNLKDE